MKRKISIGLIALVFIFQACKQIPQDIETIFTVDISAYEINTKGFDYLFGGNAIFDPNLNPETRNWEITNLIIGEIRLNVVEANILDWLIASQLRVTITDNVTNASISQLIEGYHSLLPSNSILIPTNEENNAFLNDLITEKHEAKIEVDGYSNQSGVELKFSYTIDVIASVIK